MKQMDDNIGYVLKKLQDMGQLDNTIIVFTTDNGAETITFPDGGTTPFKGGKLSTWKAACALRRSSRWPGVIKPGTIKNDIFASLDWLPTFVNIGGGAKGDALKKRIEAGQYPGIVKTTLDGVDQTEYLSGRSEKSARDTFFYYSGKDPSAVRYKNWKIYFTMVSDNAAGPPLPERFLSLGPGRQYQARPVRDLDWCTIQDSSWVMGGVIGSPSTAYVYDWNMLPIGQALWLKETRELDPVPAAPGPGELQPRIRVLQQLKQAKIAGRSDWPRQNVDPDEAGAPRGARQRNRRKAGSRSARGPVGTFTSDVSFRCIKRIEPVAYDNRRSTS